MTEQIASWRREGGKLLREERKIRLAVTLLLLVFLVAGRSAITDPPFVLMAVVLMIGSFLITWFYGPRGRTPAPHTFQLSAVATAVLELTAITLLLRGSGGLNSGFYSLYLVSLIFAAVFFRGLELILLTTLAAIFYLGVSLPALEMADNNLWHFIAKLLGMILIACYTHALAGVLHREKEANDQLLRHLTEGVMLLDRAENVTMANPTMLQMIGYSDEQHQIVGRKRSELMARDKVLGWMLGDATKAEAKSLKVRVGCFPEADLPLVECTTIPCASDSETGGWVIVCKDLRDLKNDSRPQLMNKLAPLSNLRALSEALYAMANQLGERKRWQAMEAIERHTLALQSILADMLHCVPGSGQETALNLDFVDISSLLASTRRLLEIRPVGSGITIELYLQQGLPEINADRGRLGQCLLQLCKTLLTLGCSGDKLVVDVRATDHTVVFTLQLCNSDNSEMSEALSEEETERFEGLADLPIFRVIEEHQGEWSCTPASGHSRCCVVLQLPISGPALSAEEVSSSDGGGTVTAPPSKIGTSLDPALAAEITNQLRNTLSVIRGYAETALEVQELDGYQSALSSALNLSDQASALVEILQPSVGEFDLEVKVSPEQGVGVYLEPIAPVTSIPAADGSSILVCDDEPSMRELLVDVLKLGGYHAVQASDGRGALELIRTAPLTLAFVDLAMPHVTGVEVLKEAKQLAPNMPIILMTGYATPVAVSAIGDEKPYAILTKPFAISDVLSLVKAVVSSQNAQVS